MDIKYVSTRGDKEKVTASQAILRGIAPDGGLYVPETFPKLDKSLAELKGLNYREIAYEVMKLFLTDFTEEELKACIDSAYDSKFDTEEIVPMKEADGLIYLELFHGPTLAFKDMALSILPYLMVTSAKKNELKEKIIILTATSGDTGKAALAGFADVEGTGIIVFYPKDGVSPFQRQQMVTEKGKNTSVVAIEGNFDDAQNGVKAIFSDKALAAELKEKGYVFSSANSINIGRLVPQIVYYVYAYVKLLNEGKLSPGEILDVCVPTGNFGNILAASFAKKLGLPLGKLICASNTNKVLFDFFKTGTYDRDREFTLTISPSMDILISSNLERLIYRLCDCDAAKNAKFMSELVNEGRYTIDKTMADKLTDFEAGFATEEDTLNTIKEVFDKTGYVIDTHTAVAAFVANEYRNKNTSHNKILIASTASPFKFAGSVLTALEYDKVENFTSEWDKIRELERLSGKKLPEAAGEIENAKVIHKDICAKDEMKALVKEKILK
jgi:threonine synthase